MNEKQGQMLEANLCLFCWHKSGGLLCKPEDKLKCVLLNEYKENIRKVFEEPKKAWAEYKE